MADSVHWTADMQRFLITKWEEMLVKGILDGKTKRNSVAYERIAAAMLEQFPHLNMDANRLKTPVKNKMKYLTQRFYLADAKNKSGAGRDDILILSFAEDGTTESNKVSSKFSSRLDTIRAMLVVCLTQAFPSCSARDLNMT